MTAHFLAKNYVWIIFTLGTIFIAFETIEHIKTERAYPLFYFVEVFLIVLLLAITAFLTSRLLNSLDEGSQAVRILHFRNTLGVLLSACHDITEMSRKLVQQMALIAPQVDIELYLYEKNNSWFTPAAMKTANASGVEREDLSKEMGQVPGIDPHLCRRCLAQSYPGLRPMKECAHRQHFDPSLTQDGYCLPLSSNMTPVGLLHLHSSTQKDLDAEQKMMLENISLPTAGYLNTAIEKKAREEDVITQKTRAVQLEIARDLHDTIGQNIGYLRMKLDLLSETDLQNKPDMDVEIRHMRQVANDSYDLVRGTLAVLQSGGSTDLLRLFSRYGEQVAERSTFEMNYSSRGAPKLLTSHQVRQLFYIYREALSNVEKHAQASQVCVEMVWEEDGLTLVITDNGRGFDPAQIPYGGHYGLRFLRDRAGSIGGSLSIHSGIGAGTNIVVHAPCCG